MSNACVHIFEFDTSVIYVVCEKYRNFVRLIICHALK